MSTKWDRLIGKKVESVEIDPSKTHLRFRLEGGESVAYVTDGDCCSESWIEHVGGIGEIVGNIVASVEEVELGSGAGTRQEYDKIYAVTMKLAKGYRGEFVVEFRNSSNGYYGGSLDLFGENYHTRGKPDDVVTEPIKEDF